MTESDTVYAEFLAQKGSVGLLATIDKADGNTFGELEENLDISQTTLNKRIERAEELELIQQAPLLPDDHANARRYMLTYTGGVLRVCMYHLSVLEAYQDKLEAENRIDEKTETIEEWLRDLPESRKDVDFHEKAVNEGLPGDVDQDKRSIREAISELREFRSEFM